jgi:hypothetical protein
MCCCRWSPSIIIPVLTVWCAEVLLGQLTFIIDMLFFKVSALVMTVILDGVSVYGMGFIYLHIKIF